LASLGHPCKFQQVSRLGSVTARQSNSERQPNFAALNRGRYLCLAGRPSRWALAHILVKHVLMLFSVALKYACAYTTCQKNFLAEEGEPLPYVTPLTPLSLHSVLATSVIYKPRRLGFEVCITVSCVLVWHEALCCLVLRM